MNPTPWIDWYERSARPFLGQHAPDRLPSLDNDLKRLRGLLDRSDKITACFVGNSGIGKSTLLNALVAGREQVLPSGGIGPLTAQATEVHYSDVESFEVVYHQRKLLWRLTFALEQRLLRGTPKKKATEKQAVESESVGKELTDDERQEVLEEFRIVDAENAPDAAEAPEVDRLGDLVKQARLIVTGDQFSQQSLQYLVDALRIACGYKPLTSTTLLEKDADRIARIREVLELSKEGKSYRLTNEGNRIKFREELQMHAAGFLSPMIARISVGWPSDLLKSGVVLVDLPGVGIADDTYRRVTREYVQEKARAVILVVDRAGPTEASMDMLRTTGYWDRLVGSSDDPTSDPCNILIAVTKVDEVAEEERRNLLVEPKPKKRDVFIDLVGQFRPRMRQQVIDQLGKMESSSNQSINEARTLAKTALLDGLEVHPVSATEFRKLLIDDDDDRPFLSDPIQSGIPEMQRSLVALSEKERDQLHKRREEVFTRLSRSVSSEIEHIKQRWQEGTRAAEEAERVEAELKVFLVDKNREFDQRVGAFREFLQSTVKARIETLVKEAREVAEEDVRRYLYSLQSAHWTTLRAAVRRGGAFMGARHIDLPHDIAGFFQEPMAAIWGQKLLKDIRKKTGELASDIQSLVEEVCKWAEQNAGALFKDELMTSQKQRVKDHTDQLRQVGKEAVDELRALVRQRLLDAISKPIQDKCREFVSRGDDIGAGVKSRIIYLFQTLAKDATVAAEKPAQSILTSNFGEVRKEIQATFEQWGSPLRDTAELIVESHETRTKRSDAQKRRAILEQLDQVEGGRPFAAMAIPA